MAEKGAKRARAPKQDTLVTWRIESFPVQVSQNKQYTDKLVGILDKRIRRTPTVFALYNHGRLVSVGQSDRGIAKMKAHINSNKKRMWFDRFSVYTLSKRRQLNDIEALANRLFWPQKPTKNFTRAKNLSDPVRKDVRMWASSEARRINRTLRPIERRLNRSINKLDRKEKKLRKSYLKRIDKARDKNRQRSLRSERDKKLKMVSMERKRLQPWRNQIAQWNAKLKTFQNLKV